MKKNEHDYHNRWRFRFIVALISLIVIVRLGARSRVHHGYGMRGCGFSATRQWMDNEFVGKTGRDRLDESRRFYFKDYAIDHQGPNVIDIKIDYDYKNNIGLKDKYEYPEFTQIYKYIDNYLKTYPNEDDFWEILNKNLTDAIMNDDIPTERNTVYKMKDIVTRLTIEIDVHPTEKLPYYRSSTVTRYPSKHSRRK